MRRTFDNIARFGPLIDFLIGVNLVLGCKNKVITLKAGHIEPMQSQIREQEAAERGISVWASMPQEARNAIYRAVLVAVPAVLPDLTFEKLQPG